MKAFPVTLCVWLLGTGDGMHCNSAKQGKVGDVLEQALNSRGRGSERQRGRGLAGRSRALSQALSVVEGMYERCMTDLHRFHSPCLSAYIQRWSCGLRTRLYMYAGVVTGNDMEMAHRGRWRRWR